MFLRLILIGSCILPLAGCISIAPSSKSTISDVPGEATTLMESPTNVVRRGPSSAEQPVRMAILWKETVLQSQSKNAKRGFVGRIYFYNSNDELVQVDGELNVYMYDDTTNSQGEIPDRKFVFPADKFHTHYNPSEIGHSYSIWVPCANYGDVRKSISLVPKFTSRNNRFIMAKATRLTLSGRSRTAEANYSNNNSASPKGNTYDRNGTFNDQRRANTIPIPHEIAERIQNAPANRIPTRQAIETLNDMESPHFNREGDHFNQLQIRRTQQDLNAHSRPYATQTFSDTRDQQNQHVYPTPERQPSRPFGMPGSIR